jgi:putative tryptophan/tyrosine transport system substrate-binding protein
MDDLRGRGDRMIARRTVLVGLASVILTATRAFSQTAKTHRIGHLAVAGPTDTQPPPPANWEAFLEGLGELGYREGGNIVFEHGYAGGRPERFPELAADLVRRRVEVIFARGPHAVIAAKRATRTIPIAGIDLESDPVAAGLVASIAKPAGNVTGMFLDLAELSGKQLQLLKDVVPGLSRVGVIGDSTVNASQFAALRRVGDSAAVRVHNMELRSADGVDRVFEEARREMAQGLIILSNPLSLAQRSRLASLALKAGLPTMHLYRAHADAGGLMSYGPDLPAMHKRCAYFVARILTGTPPGELPVERPTTFEFVVNLKTAQTLRVNLPQSLLVRADDIIQ